MKIIVICGSLRYKDEMMKVALDLELNENIVITPIYPVSDNKDDFSKEEMDILSRMHLEKIRLADAIFVVNVDGYIGSSTKGEIEFAKSLNKEIMYLEN